MVTLDLIADLMKLAASPVGQSILDTIITGGAASPEKVSAEVAKLKVPQPPKENSDGNRCE